MAFVIDPQVGELVARGKSGETSGRQGERLNLGLLRWDGAGVERARTRGQSVADGGALAVRSARQEQHGGAGASPAGAAARVQSGGRLASLPALPPCPSLAP